MKSSEVGVGSARRWKLLESSDVSPTAYRTGCRSSRWIRDEEEDNDLFSTSRCGCTMMSIPHWLLVTLGLPNRFKARGKGGCCSRSRRQRSSDLARPPRTLPAEHPSTPRRHSHGLVEQPTPRYECVHLPRSRSHRVYLSPLDWSNDSSRVGERRL